MQGANRGVPAWSAWGYLPMHQGISALSRAYSVLQEGPVHDVQWAPEGGRFCIIAGYMPAQVSPLGCLVLATAWWAGLWAPV